MGAYHMYRDGHKSNHDLIWFDLDGFWGAVDLIWFEFILEASWFDLIWFWCGKNQINIKSTILMEFNKTILKSIGTSIFQKSLWPSSHELQFWRFHNQWNDLGEPYRFESWFRNRHISRYWCPQGLILAPMESWESALSIRPVFVQFGHHQLEIWPIRNNTLNR